MTPYDFVHLVLLAAGGRIQGRTLLQKKVYFAGILTGMAEELGFRAHYHGPFAPPVAGAIDDLRGLGFLDQNIFSSGKIDPKGFEVARYDYTLTEDGKKVAEEKAGEHPEEWKRIVAAVQKLQQAKTDDYIKLSIAAKTYFLLMQQFKEQKKSVTAAELVELMPKFGWRVTPEQIEEAGKLLDKLGLIQVSETP